MTPEETREAAAVMLAFADGKKIEASGLMPRTPWRELKNPAWDWAGFDYRVAPEPWTGKIWVREGGWVCEDSETDDKQSFESRGWRLITVKEVGDE